MSEALVFQVLLYASFGVAGATFVLLLFISAP